MVLSWYHGHDGAVGAGGHGGGEASGKSVGQHRSGAGR